MPRFHSWRALGLSIGLVGAGCSAPAQPVADRTQPIVGGVAEPNHHYVVALMKGGAQSCTGTVISKHTVLTAGHCIGSLDSVSFDQNASSGKTLRIKTQTRHPMYSTICDDDATYDLGVLQLDGEAPSQAAPLLRQTLDNSKKYVGPSWTWVGYGMTKANGPHGARRAVTFPITLVGPSAGTHGSLCDIPETLIYATGTKRNACNGDSGGPSFFVQNGVEYEAGVTSSGDADCVLDDTQQRTDQPYIDGFIQKMIDQFEDNDPCRGDGKCDESCNQNGQLGDPDCAANHCDADGICAEACVAPIDPDCMKSQESNCADNGICDPSCGSDPDCVRQCGAEGNCIPGCATPDPDCRALPDGGAMDGGPSTDAAMPDGGSSSGGEDMSAVDAGRDSSQDPLPPEPSGGCQFAARPGEGAIWWLGLLWLGLSRWRRSSRAS